MSDKLRTALKGGGRIIISIDRWANGDFHLCVTEDWARLTSIERATVSAEAKEAGQISFAEFKRLYQQMKAEERRKNLRASTH